MEPVFRWWNINYNDFVFSSIQQNIQFAENVCCIHALCVFYSIIHAKELKGISVASSYQFFPPILYLLGIFLLSLFTFFFFTSFLHRRPLFTSNFSFDSMLISLFRGLNINEYRWVLLRNFLYFHFICSCPWIWEVCLIGLCTFMLCSLMFHVVIFFLLFLEDHQERSYRLNTLRRKIFENTRKKAWEVLENMKTTTTIRKRALQLKPNRYQKVKVHFWIIFSLFPFFKKRKQNSWSKCLTCVHHTHALSKWITATKFVLYTKWYEFYHLHNMF